MVYEFLGIGAVMGIMFGALLDPYRKASLKRKMLKKKNIGILHMVTGGRTIKTFQVDFNQDKFKIGNATWLLRPGRIYKMVGSKIREKQDINETNIKYQSGIPVIFCSMDDMVPLHFKHEPSLTGSRNPLQVGATLAKEISAAEAEIMMKQKTKLLKIMIVCLILAGGAAAMAFMAFNATNQLGSQVTSQISNLEVQLATIQTTLHNTGSVVIP